MTDLPRQDCCGCSAEPMPQASERGVPTATDALVPFIVEHYHEAHRVDLPELTRLAQKVERVHAAQPNCPHGLAQQLIAIEADLDAHMQKEEQVLFPLLLAGGGGCAPMAIQRMRNEHDDHQDRLEALACITNNYTIPDGACRSWRALYEGCAKLDADLREHIRIENELLFPAFESYD